MPKELERIACCPLALDPKGFNQKAVIPYGCKIDHIRRAMRDFLGFINQQLATKKIPRLESFLMPANFSSMVGEFMTAAIPKYCRSVVKNRYHNGHPDMVPKGKFPGDAALHATEGIEIKASRHGSGWQGHNAENVWLMVFVFAANSARDSAEDRSQALPVRQGGRGPIGQGRLGFFGPLGNESPNNHGQRNTNRLQEDGSQLDLPGGFRIGLHPANGHINFSNLQAFKAGDCSLGHVVVILVAFHAYAAEPNRFGSGNC